MSKSRVLKSVGAYTAIIIIAVLVGLLINFKLTINRLENELINIKEESIDVELENCPFCCGAVECYPIGAHFYIECQECGLETDFFNTKSEAAAYWNNMFQTKKL